MLAPVVDLLLGDLLDDPGLLHFDSVDDVLFLSEDGISPWGNTPHSA